LVTNTSNSPKEVKYTGGIRDLTKTVIVNGKSINPIKRFDNPVDAYNDIYHDIHLKLNGGSSWVKPETTIEAYIHKFAPKEDQNNPASYTQHMIERLNTDLKSAGSSTVISNTSTLGDIKSKLLEVGVDPDHAFTKAHLKTEDPTVLRDLNKEPSSTLQSISTSATTPNQNNVVKPNLEVKPKIESKVEVKPLKPLSVIKKIEEAKPNSTTEQATSSELKELLTSNIPLGQKVNTIINGIDKNLIKEPMANIESWYDETFGKDKTIYPDASVSNIKRLAAIERIKSAKDKTFKQTKINETNKYFQELPAMNDGDQYNLDKLTFNHRNKRENKEVNTKGVVLQTINPIIDDVSKLKPFQLNQQLIALDKDSGKISFPKSKDDLPKNSVFTTANKFVVTDFDAEQKTKDVKNGTGTWFPTLVTKDGKKLPYTVGASMNDNTRNEGLYGGKLLLVSEDGKHKQLFFGSVSKLQKDFYNFKQKTNSNEVSVIQLDQGSYNRIVVPKNSKMTSQDWQQYDAKNVSGGHAFYITTSAQENIIKPNLETKVETKVNIPKVNIPKTKIEVNPPINPNPKLQAVNTNLNSAPKDASKITDPDSDPGIISNYLDMTKRFLVKKGIMDPEEQAQSSATVKTPVVKTPIVKKEEKVKEEVPTFYKKLSETNSKRGGTVVSYINQFDRKKGFDYVATTFANEKDSTYNNVSHVAHFIYDMDFTTGKVNSSDDSETGNFKRRVKTVEDLKSHKAHNPGSTVNDPYVTLYQPVNDGKTTVQYLKKSEIKSKDIKNLGDVLRQYRYSDLDWDGPKGRAAGFASSIAAVKTKTGESTFFIQPKKAGNKASKDYDQFGGGSVIYFIEGTDIAIDFAGSNYQIKAQAEDLIKNYKISPDKLIISYHDLGSYSAKPGGKDGKLSNAQYKNFNRSKGVGAALTIPVK